MTVINNEWEILNSKDKSKVYKKEIENIKINSNEVLREIQEAKFRIGELGK